MAPLCPSDISPCYVRIWAGATRPPKPPLWMDVPSAEAPACAGKTVVCAGKTVVCAGSAPHPGHPLRLLRFAKGTGDHEGRPYGLNWQPSTKWSKKLGLVSSSMWWMSFARSSIVWRFVALVSVMVAPRREALPNFVMRWMRKSGSIVFEECVDLSE